MKKMTNKDLQEIKYNKDAGEYVQFPLSDSTINTATYYKLAYQHMYMNTEVSTVPAERDEQGNFYGYKVLRLMFNGEFFSPTYSWAKWDKTGYMESDVEPTERNKNGIYFMKKANDYEIIEYAYYCNRPGFSIPVLVKCLLSGIVIEGELGFRAQQAQIIYAVIEGRPISWEHAQEFAYKYASNTSFDAVLRKNGERRYG